MLRKTRELQNEKGLATIETVVLALVFVLLTSFGLGFFGIIHTGIVNSISARHYAFDTFQNRTHLVYHRDDPAYVRSPSESNSYRNYGFRLHTITVEGNDSTEFIAPARNIAVTSSFNTREGANVGDHQRLLGAYRHQGRERESINPVWVKAGYGICLTAVCGGSP